jgi:hypothetical protein
MSTKIRIIAAAFAAAALLSAVGVDVAEAGTYPKGSSFHNGGEGATMTPSPDPTTGETASFAPKITGRVACGAVAWAGGCG